MALSRDRPVIDICRLCGITKPLTFEHVTPRGAFNAFPRYYPPAQELLANQVEGTPMSGNVTLNPTGAGAYTFCEKCNNKCGRYAMHFIEWAIAWRNAMDAQRPSNYVGLTQATRRARIMKQIMSMFLSANPPGFGAINPEVRRYVKNATSIGLPPALRVFAGLTPTLDARQAAVTGYLSLHRPSSTFSEIAFAPFIITMTIGSAPPDDRLRDITFLAQSGWDDRPDTTLELPVMEFTGPIPGVFNPW